MLPLRNRRPPAQRRSLNPTAVDDHRRTLPYASSTAAPSPTRPQRSSTAGPSPTRPQRAAPPHPLLREPQRAAPPHLPYATAASSTAAPSLRDRSEQHRRTLPYANRSTNTAAPAPPRRLPSAGGRTSTTAPPPLLLSPTASAETSTTYPRRRQDSSIGFGAPVRTNMSLSALTNVVVASSLLESVESNDLTAYGLIPE
nr:ATP-dependent Clp protease ATP-binding subunit ClpX [Ipomoea batatas]